MSRPQQALTSWAFATAVSSVQSEALIRSAGYYSPSAAVHAPGLFSHSALTNAVLQPRAKVWAIIKSSILIACVQPSSRTLPWLPPFWASCIAAFTAFSGYFAPACDAACECCAHSHSPEMICMAMWIFHSISPHPAAQMLNCIPEAHQACVSTCPA